MLPNMGVWDWVIILGIILLLFGGKRLPELARALGKSISSFKKGMKEGEEELKRSLDEDKDSENKSS